VRFRKGSSSEIEESRSWTYRESASKQYSVGFRDGRVDSVLYFAQAYELPSLFGISSFGRTEDYIQKLGEPALIDDAPDGSSRLLHYPALNLSLIFMRNSLGGVGIRDDGKTFGYKGDD
jgi:hypothetical protein